MSKQDEKYTKLVARRLATKDKVERNKIAQETRAYEREQARQGRVLTAIPQHNGGVKLEVKQTSTKRSHQEEYCRKFSDEIQVVMKEGEKPTTLYQHHRKRLLGD